MTAEGEISDDTIDNTVTGETPFRLDGPQASVENIQRIKAEAIERSGETVDIDLANIKSMNSASIGALVRLRNEVAESSGRTVSLSNMRDDLRKKFLIMRLDKIFKIEQPKE